VVAAHLFCRLDDKYCTAAKCGKFYSLMGKHPEETRTATALRVRRTVTPALLASNRENAKKGGRPKGSTSSIKRDLAERCRANDARYVQILDDIAQNSTNEGYRLTAIRDLMDRGHGRPTQAISGQGPGGAIPFVVQLPVAISNDDN
jgi:hypothetical protein